MAKNPRNYPDTIPSAESGRPMTRGEKLVSFKVEGRAFTYKQPGWWCSLTDPDDVEGQLVGEDKEIVPGQTLNRLCASGLDAVVAGARAIRAGEIDLAIAGGVEIDDPGAVS